MYKDKNEYIKYICIMQKGYINIIHIFMDLYIYIHLINLRHLCIYNDVIYLHL